MSKSDILAELPKLTPEDRGEILDHLWRLEEEAAIRRGPTEAEKALLDKELADFLANPGAGAPWSETEARLRHRA